MAAIREEETVPQLASRYGIHPMQINNWRWHSIEQAAELFSRGDSAGKDKENVVSIFTPCHRAIDGGTEFFGQSAQSLSVRKHKLMLESDNPLNLVRQCQLPDVSRSAYYYRPRPIDDGHLVLLRKMDEQYLNRA